MQYQNIDKIIAARATRYRVVKPLMSKDWAVWDNLSDDYLKDDSGKVMYFTDKKILEDLVVRLNKGDFDE